MTTIGILILLMLGLCLMGLMQSAARRPHPSRTTRDSSGDGGAWVSDGDSSDCGDGGGGGDGGCD